MKIRLADEMDQQAILKYDRHIPPEQEAKKIMYWKELSK